jgi:hypothetical protein
MSDEKKSNILAVIERNQSEMLRRLEVIEHKLGIASYSHSRPKLVRKLGDYCPSVVEYDNENCYLCGKLGTLLSYEQHEKLFGGLGRCSNHGQKENNDSAESNSVSKDSIGEGK